MNKEYKIIYDLVNKLKYSPAYIKFKNGVYSIIVYSLDYSPLGNGRSIYFENMDLNLLKEQIKEVLQNE